ncbi:hypothetical protein ACJMK2_012663 [Sinanodonta woodiana]|uniref:Uncharacterized protein n=1 Tax=Sinanodonta woodiana TaxID=1069815 RepID=A0ABD3V8X9_SINWO
MMRRENQAKISSKFSRQPSFYKGFDHPSRNQELVLVLDPAARTHSHMHSMVPYTLPNQHQSVDANGLLHLDGFLEFERDDGARTFCELMSLNRLERSLDFSPSDDWNYFQSAQNLWSIEEKLEYLVSICHAGCRKLKKIQSAFHQGYYLYKYTERDREQCTNFIQKHMSLSQSKKLKQLYMQLGCFRTLSHCTLSIRHIVNHITHVRNLIESQSLEARQFWKFPPSKDPYQFLQAYQEWHHLEESAVYHMGLPDNQCDVDVIKQHTMQILTNVTSDSIWKIEHFLANSAVENRYLLMIDKGNLGNCFILYRNKSGAFSLMDDRFKCLRNMESGSKIHLLTIQ